MSDQNDERYLVRFTHADQEVPPRSYDFGRVMSALRFAFQAAGRVNFTELDARKLRVFTSATASVAVTALIDADMARVYRVLYPVLSVVPREIFLGKMNKATVLAKMEELSRLAT